MSDQHAAVQEKVLEQLELALLHADQLPERAFLTHLMRVVMLKVEETAQSQDQRDQNRN